MNNVILNPPICKIESFDNLFIELTAKNCNQRCKNCYIDFPINKNIKDFISIDTVKKAIEDTKNQNIQCIYLTGAEPMTHPHFNQILRSCLKKCSVCICTNGTLINEKKARFLKRVEDESENEVIFKLSIDHFDELKNDETRSRGSYRTTLNAIKYLVKYGFNPILCITNYYNEPTEILLTEFKKICYKIGFEAKDNNFVINNYFDKKNNNIDTKILNEKNLDCRFGRILTAQGIYSCPFLANDYRGRCGSDFTDFSKQNTLESEYCISCQNNKHPFFSIDFNKF